MYEGSFRQKAEKYLHRIGGIASVQVSLNPPESISDKADAVKLDQRNHALSKAIKKVLEYVKLTTYKLKGVT